MPVLNQPTAAKRKKKAESRKHPWRENLETLTGAIVLALIFKAFLVEISRIPSPSMQPTLMGLVVQDPSGRAGLEIQDRVLVDKLSFRFRDPERWEIVVFKHPIERSRNMVKRVVGLPGEELRIENGDVFVRRGPEDEWTIPRRAKSVQHEMWRAVDRDEPTVSSWRVREDAQDWSLVGRDIAARGDGRVGFKPDQTSIYNIYLDGYPDSVRDLRANLDRSVTSAVGDVRVEAEVTALPGCREVTALLYEGDALYRFRLPGPAADAGARPAIELWSAAAFLRPERGQPRERIEGEPWKLRAGGTVDFAAQNLDDRVTLEVDGDWVCELDVEPVPELRSWIELQQLGEGADLEDVMVRRDLHYLPPSSGLAPTLIPEGNFYMLGDNTQASADSREWEAITYGWTDEDGVGHRVRGNHRPGGENPSSGAGPDGAPARFFRDEWGERHQLPANAVEVARERHPSVPADLVRGRALAIFWPFKPSLKLWRLAWLN